MRLDGLTKGLCKLFVSVSRASDAAGGCLGNKKGPWPLKGGRPTVKRARHLRELTNFDPDTFV
jgi:hypothetical protein